MQKAWCSEEGKKVSEDLIAPLEAKIDNMCTRLTTLEQSVIALMRHARKSERVMRWVKTVCLVLIGIAVGSGLVKLNDVLPLIGVP